MALKIYYIYLTRLRQDAVDPTRARARDEHLRDCAAAPSARQSSDDSDGSKTTV